jgi:hypothetical protein
MARKRYDPLVIVPSPKTVRDKLIETLSLAERLRILLELSEKVHSVDANCLDLDTVKNTCTAAGYLKPEKGKVAVA